MKSLENLVLNLQKRKREATKIRQKVENQLREVKSLERRSSSGLASVEKKIELEQEDSSDVADVLTQKTSQLESIERLVAAAQERLIREKEALEEAERQIEFSENDAEKQNAEARLNSIKGHIEEIEFEIKSRQKTAKKIAEDVEKQSEIKSKITSKIKKQAKSKPTLKQTLVESHKDAEKLEKELEKRLKSEETAKNSLDKAVAKLREIKAKKPSTKKSAPKKAKKPSTKKSAPKK